MKILNDFNTSVRKALSEIDKNYESYNGLVICGTHSPHDWEEMIKEIHTARIEKTPFLGICFGHQLAAIEYARYVLGIEDATSEEFSDKGTFVVIKRNELNVGLKDGETYWNNYEVYEPIINNWPDKPDYFFTCQFHPEYQSSKKNPHPLLVEFIQKCKEN